MGKISSASQRSFSKTKQIFKDWNKYNSILTEVTEDELQLVQAAVDKAAASKKTTITCFKGKLTKKVTAVKPKCPTGYNLKK